MEESNVGRVANGKRLPTPGVGHHTYQRLWVVWGVCVCNEAFSGVLKTVGTYCA